MALIKPIPKSTGVANPQFAKDDSGGHLTCTSISSGDTVTLNSHNKYDEIVILNDYTGSFTVTFGSSSLNPMIRAVKTDNTVVQLDNDTTYDASEYTLIVKNATASGYTATISFS